MWQFLRVFLLISLPAFALVALPIWKPSARKDPAGPVGDRIAWTIFALGVCLMLTMTLHCLLSESDGDFRTWETIRAHVRIFLGISLIPIAGPLAVFALQAHRGRLAVATPKKPPVDGLE